MKIICAWCNKDMGEKEPLDNLETTHGMCPMCHFSVMIEALVVNVEKETKRLRRAYHLLSGTSPCLSELKTQEDVDYCADIMLTQIRQRG